MPGTGGQVGGAVRVRIDALREYEIEACTRAGLAEEVAREVTEVQLEANLRGQSTQNMGAVTGYCRRIAAGAINTRPELRVERETTVSLRLDGDGGPGRWIGVRAMRHPIAKAKQSGIGLVVARRSNHYGAAGHYAWMAATEGPIGLRTTSGGPVLAPWGGTTPTFGDNPLGVGIPAGTHPPILLDIAMSVVAQGKTSLAMAEGKPIPLGWLFDKEGRLSTPGGLTATASASRSPSTRATVWHR
jgi:LDH2 family malate/lactate/ureidoglycolate dehydrogenase